MQGLLATMPLRRNSRGHHYFDDFSKQKPVKPPAERLRYRMGKNREPRQTSREKYNFPEKSAQ